MSDKKDKGFFVEPPPVPEKEVADIALNEGLKRFVVDGPNGEAKILDQAAVRDQWKRFRAMPLSVIVKETENFLASHDPSFWRKTGINPEKIEERLEEIYPAGQELEDATHACKVWLNHIPFAITKNKTDLLGQALEGLRKVLKVDAYSEAESFDRPSVRQKEKPN